MTDRKFRQHPLSHIPGGCIVKIIKVDGFIEEHDWVKNPERYISEALDVNDLLVKHSVANKKNMIAEIYVDNELVWDTNDQDGSLIQPIVTELNKADAKKLSYSARQSLANVKKYCKRH